MSFDYAYIGYNNLAAISSTTITGLNISSGFSANAAANWQAFDFVQFDSGACSLIFDCGQTQIVDYMALAGHTLFSTNADDIKFESANLPNFIDAKTLMLLGIDSGGDLPIYSGSQALNTVTMIDAQTVKYNPVVSFRFDPVSARYYRLTFTAAAICRVGVIALGKLMEFQRGFYGGFSPPSLNEQIDVTNNKSESGQYLGRSIVRNGVSPITIELDPVTRAWVDTVWTPFRDHADLLPFVFKWGLNPLADNMLAVQKSWSNAKLSKRIYRGSCKTEWMSVGVNFEGVNR